MPGNKQNCFEVISLLVKSSFNIGFPEWSQLRWKGTTTNSKLWKECRSLQSDCSPNLLKHCLTFLFGTVFFAYRSSTLDWVQGEQMALFIVKLYYGIKTKQPENSAHKRFYIVLCVLVSSVIFPWTLSFSLVLINFSFLKKTTRILLFQLCQSIVWENHCPL